MFTFKTYIAVMFGGALGTGLRLWLSGLLAARYGDTFPVGTLVVNILGSFIIGAYASITGPEGLIPATPSQPPNRHDRNNRWVHDVFLV
jgi:fluoride exporter